MTNHLTGRGSRPEADSRRNLLRPSGIRRALFALSAVGVIAGCRSEEPRQRSEVAAVQTHEAADEESSVITVYKTATCPCCSEWVTLLRNAGLEVEAKDVDATELTRIRTAAGVPNEMASCHTAVVGPYVLEGHVPIDLVRNLIRERPDIRGLAVPGMPAGVEGMPSAAPDRPSYQIFALQVDGGTNLYATR